MHCYLRCNLHKQIAPTAQPVVVPPYHAVIIVVQYHTKETNWPWPTSPIPTGRIEGRITEPKCSACSETLDLGTMPGRRESSRLASATASAIAATYAGEFLGTVASSRAASADFLGSSHQTAIVGSLFSLLVKQELRAPATNVLQEWQLRYSQTTRF